MSSLELSSASLGGSVVSVSDDFFAEVSHLLLTEVTGRHVLSCTDLAYLPCTARTEPEGAVRPQRCPLRWLGKPSTQSDL